MATIDESFVDLITKKVSEDEAARRQEICNSCEMKDNFSLVPGGEKVDRCKVCKCSIKALTQSKFHPEILEGKISTKVVKTRCKHPSGAKWVILLCAMLLGFSADAQINLSFWKTIPNIAGAELPDSVYVLLGSNSPEGYTIEEKIRFDSLAANIDTDEQTLSFVENQLSISNGNSVDLSGLANTDEQDLQNVLERGNTSTLGASMLDLTLTQSGVNAPSLLLSGQGFTARMKASTYANFGSDRGTGAAIMSHNVYPSGTNDNQYIFESSTSSLNGGVARMHGNLGFSLLFNQGSVTAGSPANMVSRFNVQANGNTTIENLSGTGIRMVTANGAGLLSTQDIPVNTDDQTAAEVLSTDGNVQTDLDARPVRDTVEFLIDQSKGVAVDPDNGIAPITYTGSAITITGQVEVYARADQGATELPTGASQGFLKVNNSGAVSELLYIENAGSNPQCPRSSRWVRTIRGATDTGWQIEYLQSPWRLFGQNWAVFGDSFSDNPNNDWLFDANKTLKMDITTYAVSGNRADQQNTVVSNLIAANAQHFDQFSLATILVGVNDWSQDTELGAADDAANSSTVAGQVKGMIVKILQSNPLIELYLISPTDGVVPSSGYGQPNQATIPWTLEDLRDLYREIALIYHIPFIDAFGKSGFNSLTLGELSYDDLHPEVNTGTVVLGETVARSIIARGEAGARKFLEQFQTNVSQPNRTLVAIPGNTSDLKKLWVTNGSATQDWNLITSAGVFPRRLRGASVTGYDNGPPNIGVYTCVQVIDSSNTNYDRFQIAYGARENDGTWVRARSAGVWYAWKQIDAPSGGTDDQTAAEVNTLAPILESTVQLALEARPVRDTVVALADLARDSAITYADLNDDIGTDDQVADEVPVTAGVHTGKNVRQVLETTVSNIRFGASSTSPTGYNNDNWQLGQEFGSAREARRGNETNGPGGFAFYHTFAMEFGTAKDGSGNFAILGFPDDTEYRVGSPNRPYFPLYYTRKNGVWAPFYHIPIARLNESFNIDVDSLGGQAATFWRLGENTATSNVELGANAISSDGGVDEGLSFDAAGNATFKGDASVELPDFRSNVVDVAFSTNRRKVHEIYAGDGDDTTGSNVPQERSYSPTAHYTETVIGTSIASSQYGWSNLSNARGTGLDTAVHVSFNVTTGADMAIEVGGLVTDATGKPEFYRVLAAVESGNITNDHIEVLAGTVTATWYTSTGGFPTLRINAPTGSNWQSSVVNVERTYSTALLTIQNRVQFSNSNL